MKEIIRLAELFLDRHTSRRNAYSYGLGKDCNCEDCQLVEKILKIAQASKTEFEFEGPAMNWEQRFGRLPHETQMWTLLGTRRYIAWVGQNRPAYPQFLEPQKVRLV